MALWVLPPTCLVIGSVIFNVSVVSHTLYGFQMSNGYTHTIRVMLFGVQVINMHRSPATPGIYVGRPSPLGNPYRLGKDGNRAEVLQKYREWLYRQITENNQTVLHALSNLNENDVLLCYCKPLACHADVINEVWHWAQYHGLLNVEPTFS